MNAQFIGLRSTQYGLMAFRSHLNHAAHFMTHGLRQLLDYEVFMVVKSNSLDRLKYHLYKSLKRVRYSNFNSTIILITVVGAMKWQ